MKKLMFSVLAACALARVTAMASEGEWLTDLPKALAKAKAENKMVLLDFTGSDWCGWCIKFNKEVLSTPGFKEYAAKNLVLVEVDFPNKKQLAAELKKANAGLKDKYKVDGFPTFVVLNAEGKEVGRQVGYSEGGPKAFIAKLQKFKST
jgi:thioredoxin-related protein